MTNMRKRNVHANQNEPAKNDNIEGKSSSKRSRGRNAENITLSSPEIFINALVWISIAIYGSYCVYIQSKDTG